MYRRIFKSKRSLCLIDCLSVNRQVYHSSFLQDFSKLSASAESERSHALSGHEYVKNLLVRASKP